MRRHRVNLMDKAQTEVIDKARVKRTRRDASRKGKETSTPITPGGETGGVAETIKDLAAGAVATVEEMVSSASDKIHDMIGGNSPAPAPAKKTSRRAKSAKEPARAADPQGAPAPQAAGTPKSQRR